MIKQVKGDILKSKAQAIAHGIAPHDHFQHGLALALRMDYPSMARDFRHYCKIHNPKAGGAWIWSGVGGKRIICLMTQDPAPSEHSHPEPATLHNVNKSMRELAKMVKKKKLESLALPRIATGVGGLEWDDVFPIIKEHLGEIGIPVILYSTYVKDVEVDEGL